QSVKKALRLVLVLAFVFLTLLILLLVLQLTESALNVWQMLDQLSPALLAFYAVGLTGFALLTAAVSWMLFRSRGKTPRKAARAAPPAVDRAGLEQALSSADTQGIDTAEARRELDELAQRGAATTPYVVFFGPVSAGKSALIRAITGARGIEVDPRAGTTRQIAHYRFGDGEETDLMLTDAPGILDMEAARVRSAREEARRADLVVYVCDGELTRDQHAEAQALQALERPMMLALNKRDRYSDADLAMVTDRLRLQLPGVPVVAVQAGGTERVVRVDADGSETVLERERTPLIEPLMRAIEARIASEGGQLSRQRDESLVRLGAEKLDAAVREHRERESEALVRQYARKAMVGAMAAVSPGTDILIQGYLGVQMVRDLARLHEVKVQQADMERLVSLASEHLGQRLTLLLALAGNVLKAFPGIGTVTGGVMHAVAYGMIFEGLGKAVARTLQEDGALETRQALDYFEETISGNLEGRAKHFARLALEEFKAKR
ncbi:MAG: Era-like GTP-binding protein, partial [Candidatus Thiodiazotropha sp.]